MINTNYKSNHFTSFFRNGLLTQYQEARTKKHQNIELDDFLKYLITHNLIEEITIKRFAILHAFDKLYPKHNYHKSNTVKVLSQEFNLSERQIWTVLKDHTRRFKQKRIAV